MFLFFTQHFPFSTEIQHPASGTGNEVRFRAVGTEEALQARRAREARLAQVRLALSLMDLTGELRQWGVPSAEC
jgi:hypothetical protein